MIVSHTKKFVFIHIPKAGGTSVRTALEAYATVGVWQHQVNGLPPNTNRQLAKHAKAHVLRDYLGEEAWEDFYTFAFVRNPWDRLVSNYYYARKHKKSAKHQFAMSMDFTGFIRWYRDHTNVKEALRIDPQFAYVAESGRLIIDQVCKFEKINNDFANVCTRLGIRKALPHMNKSAHAGYRSYYTAETRKIVGKLFDRDCALFKYRF